MPALKDLASLMINSEYHDVTTDCDEIRILYPTVEDLLKDLQLLGESSALKSRYF